MTNNQQQTTNNNDWNCAQLGAIVFPFFPILGALGFFIALLLVWKQHFPRLIKRPLNWGLALFSIWLIIISAFAVDFQESLFGLGNFLPFLVFFVAFSSLIRTISQLRQLAWILVIPSLFVVILGLGQLFAGWNIPGFLGWHLVAGGNPEGRMASVFMYANILAAYLSIVLILGIGLWLDTYQAWRKSFKQNRPWIFLLLTATVIADAIGLILTSSRNAWAIAFLACLAFALYLGWYWLVGGVSATAGIIAWASFGPNPGRDWLRQIVPAYVWARLSDEMYPDRAVASLRTTQWHFAENMIFSRPWLGWGLRSFTPLYEAKMGLWLGHPHNLFLMLGAEIGIPATLFFSSLVGWILARAVILLNIRAKKSPDRDAEKIASDRLILFAYLVAFASCILFNCLDVTMFDLRVNTLAWLLLAAIGGAVDRHSLIQQSPQV